MENAAPRPGHVNASDLGAKHIPAASGTQHTRCGKGVVLGSFRWDGRASCGIKPDLLQARCTMTPSRDISRLLEIMAMLRTPGSGCPWDLEQKIGRASCRERV